MADKTTIEWADATWNPVRGCSRVSEGCRHCYAEGIAARFNQPGQVFDRLARRLIRPDGSTEARWTGKIAYAGDAVLTKPLTWRRPRRIFVNSMSDLFHEGVGDDIIDSVFAVMALCPQHTFQILTKRPERMHKYLLDCRSQLGRQHELRRAIQVLVSDGPERTEAIMRVSGSAEAGTWRPLSNIWLGVSVEDQVTAETRIPYLLATPAALRFLSCEPLLGPVDLNDLCDGWNFYNPLTGARWHDAPDGAGCAPDLGGSRIGWVIAGGESGRSARPADPAWFRSLRDQCAVAGVPFFFKQWGEWAPAHFGTDPDNSHVLYQDEKVGSFNSWTAEIYDKDADTGLNWRRLGKARAGRELEGRTHDGFPGQVQEGGACAP